MQYGINVKSFHTKYLAVLLVICSQHLFAQRDSTTHQHRNNIISAQVSYNLFDAASHWHVYTLNYERTTRLKNISLDVGLGYMGGSKFDVKFGAACSAVKWKITPVFRAGFRPYVDFKPSPKYKLEQLKDGYHFGYPLSFPFEPKVYSSVGCRFKLFERRFITEINSGIHYGYNFRGGATWSSVLDVNVALGFAF